MVAKTSPGYEVFRPGNRSGWAVNLLRTLEPGVPVKVPPRRAKERGARAALYSAATRGGFHISLRLVEGVLYVSRLKEEDAE